MQKRLTFSKKDLTNLMDIQIPENEHSFDDFIQQINTQTQGPEPMEIDQSESDLNTWKVLDSWEDMDVDSEELEDALVANLAVGAFRSSDLVFCKFDSSFISENDITAHMGLYLNQMRNRGIVNDRSIVVFVADVISYVESINKVFRPQKYQQKTVRNSQKYIDLYRDFDKVLGVGFDFTYRLGLQKTNQIMVEIEKTLMNPNKGRNQWVRKDGSLRPELRNEINDDAQLGMLLHLRSSFPNSKQVMFTYDSMLTKKCKKEGVFCNDRSTWACKK